ncbi:hypothetical protein [Sulfurimonas paralvinellae]|uniref:Uncharacterized protein n=1 Tax=Sulfurimonas paralvinellae TaxID=317658 RepID=A0A7M1B8G8_9BACT|nr:hypothetical protein [Sulfurimonas paralvinellae]QOP46027.1 hypothetical protein FM071_06840 [Sulfurimonas paralvinellae]
MNKEDLKAKILEAHKEADIASLYILEQQTHELFDEETLHGYYANILDLALEKLTETLEAHRVMDMNEVQDFATLRALYEYAMEHYSAGKPSDAAALFEVLGGLSNDEKFSDAMKIHRSAASENLALDDFLEKLADLQETENTGTFYVSRFTKEAQELLDNNKSTEE